MKFRPDATDIVKQLQLTIAALIQADAHHKTVDDTVAMAELLRDGEAICARAAAGLEQMAAQDRAHNESCH